MKGMRIAMNGHEAPVGQSYANIDSVARPFRRGVLDELGQPLSVLGAVLPLEQGPDFDLFFLTFDDLNGVTFDRDQDPALVVTNYIATAEAASPDIGVKTFDEIDASYAAILGVDRVNYQDGNGNFVVDETYQELRQSLPAVEDIEAFLSSHQVAIAQLAIQYCDAAVEEQHDLAGLQFRCGTGHGVRCRGTRRICRAAGSASSWPLVNECSTRLPAQLHARTRRGGVIRRGRRSSREPDRSTA